MMTVRSFRIIAVQTILRHQAPRRKRASTEVPKHTPSGRIIAENLDRITAGLTAEDFADLERISREIRQLP
jgi:hypothetical protein